jgi:hypothetical protein
MYVLNPKNYTNYTNYIMQNTLIFKNNQINFIQNQKRRYASTLNLMVKLVGYVINRVARLVG